MNGNIVQPDLGLLNNPLHRLNGLIDRLARQNNDLWACKNSLMGNAPKSCPDGGIPNKGKEPDNSLEFLLGIVTRLEQETDQTEAVLKEFKALTGIQ